ncbi:MAG: hypothetical protein QXO15_11480 [Nitrososphaerota archaeon]
MKKVLTVAVVFMLLISSLSVLAQRCQAHPVVTKRTYTSDADFDEGVLVGVEHESVHDQLQLSKEVTTFPYLWVPNEDDTVSKIDALTGKELARYRTGPEGFDGEPSRTTVDLRGSCWVANRYAGTVVKIGLYEGGDCVDRNGNGVIDTSRDANGDGIITGDEILPWGQDECVLFEVILIPGYEGTYTPGEYKGPYTHDWGYPGPRSIAVDAKNNVWVGTYGSMKFYYIDGASGTILKTIDVTPWNHHAYGAVIDHRGVLWSSGQQYGDVLRLDPSTDPPTISQVRVGHFVYGLGLDYQGHLFVSGWTDCRLTKINVTVNPPIIEWTKYKPEMYGARGVVCTSDNDVWVANSGRGTVTRYDNDGNLKATITVGDEPTGVGVDAYGKVWATNLGNEYIKRIDPSTNTVDLEVRIVGSGGHYTYSDFTGILIRTITTKIGTWTVIFDSEEVDTLWGRVYWTSFEPEGTTITVKVRSSNDKLSWSAWEDVINGVPLSQTPNGRYLQVEVTLKIISEDVWMLTPWVTPILYDITIETASAPPLEQPYIALITSDPYYPLMGEDYRINITVINPTDSIKSVKINVLESDWATAYDDYGYPNQQDQTQTANIEAGGKHTFSFTYRHTWRWLKPLEELMEGPPALTKWDIIWYVIGALGYSVPLLSEIKLLLEVVAANWGLPSYSYTYKISSDVTTVRTDYTVKVTVPYYKPVGLLLSLQNAYVGQKMTTIGIIAVLAFGAGWLFLTGAAIMQAVLIASAYACFEQAVGTPDLNYREITPPELPAIPELESLPEGSMKKMVEDSITFYADLKALTKTLQRYEAARQTNDLLWMLGQCQAAQRYLQNVINDCKRLNSSMSEFINELKANDFTINTGDIKAMKEWIENNGMPDIEVEILRRLGITEEDIGRLDDVLFQIPDDVIVRYDEGITLFGDLIPTLEEQLSMLQIEEIEIKAHFINGTVDVDPDTLNLRSKGKWITAYIELPDGYNVFDINVSALIMNYTVPVNLKPITVGDYDKDNVLDLMVKFDRQQVIDYILSNVDLEKLYESMFMTVRLTITGKLNDDTPFQGSCTIKIIYQCPRYGRFTQ